MRIALYQPEIAQNVGATIRAAACFSAGVDIIGPAGFPLGARELRRVAMDYAALAAPTLHDGWTAFLTARAYAPGRLVLLTTKADRFLTEVKLAPDDVYILGRESAGVPEDVHAAADIRTKIALAPDARSLNVAVAGAVALHEARRQCGWP
ncbi:MAG: TrmH family RNA methyltransferase [Pseudomonadota bacterium]